MIDKYVCHTTLIRLAAVIACTLLFTACPSKKKANQTPLQKVIFVKGDPYELIQGTTLNEKSFFNSKNARDLNNYKLLAVHQFVEKEEFDPNETRDIEKENAPSDGRDGLKSDIATVEMTENTDKTWTMSLFNGQAQLVFSAEEDGSLKIIELVDARGLKFPGKALHWSMTPDQNILSLLISSQDEKSGHELTVIYFEKDSKPVELSLTDTKYKYLEGPGTLINWKNDLLEIELCGSKEMQSMIEKGIISWAKHLKDRLKIRFTTASSFAPFSDLNQHCVYPINAYISESNPEITNYGLTTTVRSATFGKIFDSDIFIFKGELQKIRNVGYTEKKITAKLDYTIKHEFGHLLGLDHKFKDPKEVYEPSIMSYEYSASEPTTYDIEAIQLLYPLRN